MKKTNTVGGKKIRSGRALYTMYLCICCYLSFPNKQTVVRDLCTGLHLNAPTVDHHHHAPQTHRNDESPGRKRTRRVGVQGTPAIFYYNIPFLTPGLCCEQIQMQQHKQTWPEGGNPFPSCFIHTQTRWEGKPLLAVFSSHTDAKRGGKSSPVVFSSHTDATRGGKPSPVVFSSQTDATRGETPSLRVFITHRHDERGETLSRRVFITHRRDERGETPSRRVSFHPDTTRSLLAIVSFL
jgi:hypothetical protein